LNGKPIDLRAIQLIALDIDGTLLSPAGVVTDSTRRAVHRLRSSGVRVCLATGRSWWESRSVIDAIGLDGPGVFVGGATVNDLATGRTLSRTTIDPSTARQLCTALLEIGVGVMVMQDRDAADSEWLIAGDGPMPPTLMPWILTHGSSHKLIEKLSDHHHADTLRVGTIVPHESIGALIGQLRGRFGETIYLHEVRVPSGVTVLEVFNPVVNKWHGIRQLCDRMNMDRGGVCAVGDDFNDLQMIEAARLGVAMGNARDAVKQVADRVIGTNADDGLAAFLNELADRGAGDARAS
jgi:5-amino-6-(5-phospho-D-ribitylamino)uracil phosphatase